MLALFRAMFRVKVPGGVRGGGGGVREGDFETSSPDLLKSATRQVVHDQPLRTAAVNLHLEACYRFWGVWG